MKFFRRTAGYTLFYHKINEEILEKMKVEPVEEKLRKYKSIWVTSSHCVIFIYLITQISVNTTIN